MARIARLKRRADFLAAASGRRFHTERMTAQGRLRASDERREGGPVAGLQVGLTLTKRVGHATERNRIRRRLRAALDALADEAPDRAADVVLIGRRPALHAAFDVLTDDLRRALAAVTREGGPSGRGGRGPDRGGGKGHAVPTPGASRRTGAHVPRRGAPAGQPDGGSVRIPDPDTRSETDRPSDTSRTRGTTDG